MENEHLQPDNGANQHELLGICRKSFCARDDILLCLAVNERKPWAAPSGEIMLYWAEIAENLLRTRGFGLRKDGPACKTRFEKILKMIMGGEQEVLRKSGTEDEFAERERLVMDICRQIDHFRDGDEDARRPAVPTSIGHEDDDAFEARKKRKANKLLKVAKRERLVAPSSPSQRSPPEDMRAFFEYLKKRMEVDDAREERRIVAEKELEERRNAAEERRVAMDMERDRRQQEFMLKVLEMMKKPN
ncbi:Aste57867_19624 [Aphanomyces stellatus]|uniref:Aste57867_19624 protein n=1 Tax=Aphanomyces stellatus TaxID=120398 RepID=A0A485LDI5_9STRA|nr:hypothetical protein As57867_019559 [Aphanomyces stellatus]VFT96324.1 Aste57867_19624 [Aphanomyces stellatus]